MSFYGSGKSITQGQMVPDSFLGHYSGVMPRQKARIFPTMEKYLATKLIDPTLNDTNDLIVVGGEVLRYWELDGTTEEEYIEKSKGKVKVNTGADAYTSSTTLALLKATQDGLDAATTLGGTGIANLTIT